MNLKKCGIDLLYVKNIISRKKQKVKQTISFFASVLNTSFDKKVEIYWAGEEEVWNILPANYIYSIDSLTEVWSAVVEVVSDENTSLPGNIKFSLRLEILNKVFWNNNAGRNFFIEADSGVLLNEKNDIQHIDYRPDNNFEHSDYCRLNVAVSRAIKPKNVFIRWTDNNWETYSDTPCFQYRNYWDKFYLSNARNPNHYGYGIWTAKLKVRNIYGIHYAFACETGDKTTLWNKNENTNYFIRREPLKILTLNLHCYQESDQFGKFSKIAKAINDLNIDIVCLQEVGENFNYGRGDWQSNASRIICEKLDSEYYLHSEWAHLGFDKYFEGVAILSRFPFQRKDAGYVSTKTDIYDIHSRKVVMAQVRAPYIGLINIYSTHLSWMSGGFYEQFQNLRKWVNAQNTPEVTASFICGDFNIKAGSQGYKVIAGTKEFDDQYLKINSNEIFKKVFYAQNNEEKNIEKYFTNDGRIDYIFMNRTGKLNVLNSKVIFTQNDFGCVSDHFGYYAEFEPVF